MKKTLCLAALICVLVASASAATIDGGWYHSCALKSSDSTVWCWGAGSSGQLGNGSTTNSPTPVQVNGFAPSIPTGSLSVSITAPSVDGSTVRNGFFTVTADITCTGGVCGNVTATLDPEQVAEPAADWLTRLIKFVEELLK